MIVYLAFISLFLPVPDSFANAIQSMASVPNISASNRDKMYKLVNELRDLAQGFYPLADDFPRVDKNIDIEDISEDQIEEAVERIRVSFPSFLFSLFILT